MAKQPGIKGSNRGVILSLLSDHALLLHYDQKALLKIKEPAATVGSLREKVMTESLMSFIEGIISDNDPKKLFEQHMDKISDLFSLSSSIKHMRHVDMGFLEEKI
jgi:hypothetical protein